MKAFFMSVISLLVGLAMGGYLGYSYYERHITNLAVQELADGKESSDRLEAAKGVRAIELIQTGNTQQAIEMFSIPIADFYSSYVDLTHNDKRTKELLAQIEGCARTNQVVAAQIKMQMNSGATNAGAR
jgi:hypothetical protein